MWRGTARRARPRRRAPRSPSSRCAPRRLARLVGPPHDLPVGLTVAPLPADGPLHPRAQRDRPGCGALQPAEGELRLRGRRLAVQGALRPRAWPLTPSQLPVGSPGALVACRPSTASGWPRSWARSGPMHASWPSKTRWAHGPPSPSSHGRPGTPPAEPTGRHAGSRPAGGLRERPGRAVQPERRAAAQQEGLPRRAPGPRAHPGRPGPAGRLLPQPAGLGL
jgi:hypothetical protein